jgi:hypothetical protein
VLRGQRDEPLRLYSRLPRPEPLLLLSSSSSVVLTRLTGPRNILVDTMKENTETLTDASKEVGL